MALFLVTRIQQGIIPSNPRNNPLDPPIQHDIISSNQKIISSPRPFNRALFYLSLFFFLLIFIPKITIYKYFFYYQLK
jgi:hypothetical protein